jgi:subtilase family serine protease
VNPGHRRGALLAAALGAVTLSAGVFAPAVAAGADSSPSALPAKVALPQAVPHIPAGTARLGSVPPDRVLNLEVALAGQNPAGLAQAVAAVSTPGSPDYRHYRTSAQYAAEFGPTASEIAQVSSALRAEGLTVGAPDPGSILLPVSGAAATVSAAFGTPLESVQPPNQARAIVNTAAPQIAPSLAGAVTAVVGLDGLFQEHSMLRQKPGSSTTPGSGATPNDGAAPNAATPGSAAGAQNHDLAARASTPQACPAASAAAFGGTYTSTQMASIFGLDQLFGQGRIGIGQTIAVVEFEQYLQSDFNAFESCYGLSSPIRNVVVDGGSGGPPGGHGEAALDTELASFNAPAASLVVYEAPNNNDAQALDMFNRIAGDDTAQIVTTS